MICAYSCEPSGENPGFCGANTTSVDELCGHVTNPETSVFKSCFDHGGVEPDLFAESCVYDVCYNAPDEEAMKEAACGTLQALAAECANRGFPVDWRQAANCCKHVAFDNINVVGM